MVLTEDASRKRLWCRDPCCFLGWLRRELTGEGALGDVQQLEQV